VEGRCRQSPFEASSSGDGLRPALSPAGVNRRSERSDGSRGGGWAIAEGAPGSNRPWPRLKTPATADQWYGYEGTTVVLHQRPESMLPGPRPLWALDQWVRMGGKLVLAVGRRRFWCGRLRPFAGFRRALAPTGALGGPSSSNVPVPPAGGRSSACRIGRRRTIEPARQLAAIRRAQLARSPRRRLDLPPISQWPDRGLLIQARTT
jgi:hypothetical protein